MKIFDLVLLFSFAFLIVTYPYAVQSQINCSAPECHRIIHINGIMHIKNKFSSLFKGGDFEYFEFCPEHKERITNGHYNDNDSKTNPDLIEFQSQRFK